MRILKTGMALCFGLMSLAGISQETAVLQEQYRPAFHFTPKANWMNDPNGLFLYKGVYHIFYQYYPKATVWGPMHWGHATSTDLFTWVEQPVALYPDSLGYIFSGSAVVDKANSSGLGDGSQPPIVAIFTYHQPEMEKAKRNDFQYQGIAFSRDGGKTFTKYAGNPVLANPGITDFRDPKVSWYAPGKKWVMTLATKDRISFYSSTDLKEWNKLSEFGSNLGAHGGVWECPDLIPFTIGSKTIWALLVSINPGGPNGGSATQYFLGDFDGRNFVPADTLTRWIDYGTDNYAGVSFFNTGDRTIFLGWMSNWLYAQQVPTKAWRSALTIPRELKLVADGDKFLLASSPVKEIASLSRGTKYFRKEDWQKGLTVLHQRNKNGFELRFTAKAAADFTILLQNEQGEIVKLGYQAASSQFFIDRSRSGETSFHPEFAARHPAPRLLKNENMDIVLVVDRASVEFFADQGTVVMTDIVFPVKPYTLLSIETPVSSSIQKVQYTELAPGSIPTNKEQ